MEETLRLAFGRAFSTDPLQFSDTQEVCVCDGVEPRVFRRAATQLNPSPAVRFLWSAP